MPAEWERAAMPTQQTAGVAVDADGERFDICSHGGYIYVSTSRAVTVKVFTLLGQLVSSQTVPAGTSRLRMPARGLYIIKTDSLTRRVTV